jgi:hypothetical protein
VEGTETSAPSIVTDDNDGDVTETSAPSIVTDDTDNDNDDVTETSAPSIVTDENNDEDDAVTAAPTVVVRYESVCTCYIHCIESKY